MPTVTVGWQLRKTYVLHARGKDDQKTVRKNKFGFSSSGQPARRLLVSVTLPGCRAATSRAKSGTSTRPALAPFGVPSYPPHSSSFFAVSRSPFRVTHGYRISSVPSRRNLLRFLTLQEAEALDDAAIAGSKAAMGEEGGRGELEALAKQVEPGHFWKSLLLSWFALIETLVWLAVTSFSIIQDDREPIHVASSFVFALTWLFATVRPVVRPKPTPPYDLFALYLIYTVIELVSLSAFAYNNHVYGFPFPPPLTLAAHILNLCVLFVLVTIVLSMPLAIPSNRVEKANIVSLCDGSQSALMFLKWSRDIRFSRRLYDTLGLGHVLVGVAISKARTCSSCV
jgi:hypothetical protein